MKGYELIFMAPLSRRHNGKPVIDCIVAMAKEYGINRYTRRIDTESRGGSGHTHSAHFFELADEPVEVAFVLDAAKSDELLAAIEAEKVQVFCVRHAIEYWEFGA